MLQQLKNKGVIILNKADSAKKEKTILVTGIARSGTTMATMALSSLGINMGDQKDSAVHEDLNLIHIFEGIEQDKRKESLREFVYEKNQHHDVWGWKRPKAFHFIANYEDQFENLHYVIPFRDALSIATRNMISVNQNALNNLETILDEYKKLVRFISSCKKPMFLFSYEKAITERRDFANSLCSFLNVKNTEQNIAAITSKILLNRVDYLNQTRTFKVEGYFDKVMDKRIIKGWAHFSDTEEKVELQIFINNKLVGETIADKYRDDLKVVGKTKGFCAFEKDISSELTRFKGTLKISIKSKKGKFELNNSPKLISN